MNKSSLDWQVYIDNLVFGLGDREIKALKSIADRYPINSVLDVACGDGIAAILLAGWGKSVTGLDQDPDRIKNNHSKSISAGVEVDFKCADMRDLSKSFKHKCDLVICLRNSLSRLVSEADIWGTLVQMYLALKPGGIIVIQTFDYDRAIAEPDAVIKEVNSNLREQDAKIFFHPDLENTRARFIIETPGRCHCRQHKSLDYHEIPVRPIFEKELNLWLAELGFKKTDDLEEKTGLSGKTWNKLTLSIRPGGADK